MPTLVSKDGTSIAYEVLGSGPAVILVDGALCFRDAGPMRSIADALADDFTVYLYDRRGRGASTDGTPRGSSQAAALDREIDDLDALVTQAGGSAAGFGISSGAALLLHAAASLGPERIPRVGIYEPPYLPEAALPAAAQYTRELTRLLGESRHDEAIALFLRRVGVPEEGIEGMRRSPGWPATVALARTLAYDDAALGASRLPVELASRIRVPVLALAGGASPDFLRYGARGVAAAVPDARLEIIEGQTHDIAAAAVAPLLRAFLDPNR